MLLPVCLMVLAAGPPQAARDARVELKLDSSQAEAVLAVLERRAAGQVPPDELWTRLFASEPQRRLKRREQSMRRPFTDEEFKRFVMGVELLKRAPDLRRTLATWQQADLRSAGERILPYLPRDALVRATVYPVIKPRSNSFVFETDSDPAIFLYLDPQQSPAEFANVVAHECHHIGYSGSGDAQEWRLSGLSENARKAAVWMGALGEGLAVLAAAGSVDVHPLQDFKPEERLRWDQDAQHVDRQLGQLDQFLLDLAQGGFARPEVADHVAFTFFGYRGPWYTVGYRLGVVVEKRYGRARLVECLSDPRQLLAAYNRAAAEHNAAGGEQLALFSPELLKAVGLEPPAPE